MYLLPVILSLNEGDICALKWIYIYFACETKLLQWSVDKIRIAIKCGSRGVANHCDGV